MSLPDPITIAVDPETTGSDTTWNFDFFDKVGDKAEYRGDLHSVGLRNHKLEYYRTAPKKSGNFLGQIKSTTKLTLDHLTAGADASESYKPAIITISTSFPVGITPEQYRLMMWMICAAAEESYTQELALENEL